MLDEETDKPLVCAERRAVDAERRLLGVIPVLVDQTKALRDGEVDLIGRER